MEGGGLEEAAAAAEAHRGSEPRTRSQHPDAAYSSTT